MRSFAALRRQREKEFFSNGILRAARDFFLCIYNKSMNFIMGCKFWLTFGRMATIIKLKTSDVRCHMSCLEKEGAGEQR